MRREKVEKGERKKMVNEVGLKKMKR